MPAQDWIHPSPADRLAALVGDVLGELPLRLRAWDGSEAGPAGAPSSSCATGGAAPAALGPRRAGPGARLRRRGDRRRRRPGRRAVARVGARPATGRRPARAGVTGCAGPAPRCAWASSARRPRRPRRRRCCRGEAHHRPGQRRDQLPLRPEQRALRCPARRAHGLLVRVLPRRPGDDPAPHGLRHHRGAARQAGTDLPQARPAAGHATARRRLRLGLADPPRRRAPRRARDRRDHLGPAARPRREAGRRARAGRPGDGAPAGLPRRAGTRRGPLRRGRVDRDERARGPGAVPGLRRHAAPVGPPRRPGAECRR